ncbi:MAG: hypothetical protein CM15mP58_17780 [Burkholderiaceae bacterium]|nr:MAG: hypothetical protein CM15mP58_17780 [Burkholderiaceae bacterium]
MENFKIAKNIDADYYKKFNCKKKGVNFFAYRLKNLNLKKILIEKNKKF